MSAEVCEMSRLRYVIELIITSTLLFFLMLSMVALQHYENTIPLSKFIIMVILWAIGFLVFLWLALRRE